MNSENDNKIYFISFDDVEPACKLIFGSVWFTNRGIEFARKCWEIFSNNNLTSYKNEIERCRVGLRLISLGDIYREFSGIAFDEYVEPDFEEWAEALEITKFRVGQIIGISPDFSANEEFTDYLSSIHYLSDTLRNEVYNNLVKGFNGKEHLFYELYLTGLPDEEIDEDEDYIPSFKTPTIDEALNDHDILSNKFQAFSWVTDGCPPNY